MVHRFLNLTLKSKLILLFVIVAVFPIIFLFITFSTHSTKLTLQNSANNTETLLCQINSNLTSKISTVNSTTLNFIINKQLKNLLIEDEAILEDINRKSIISILRSTVISNPSISNMVLYGKNNRFYYFGGYLNEDFYNELDKYRIDDQFRGENVWIGRQNDILCRSTQQTQNEVFTSVSIMKDFINNEKLGYVIVNLKTQTIDDVLKNIYTGPDEKLLLVDGNKELLSSSDGLDAHVYEQDFKNHLNFSGDSGIYVEKIGWENVQIAYYRNEKTNWYIVSWIPLSSITSNTNLLSMTIIFSTVFLLFVLLVASLFFANKISDDFKQLLDFAQTFGPESDQINDFIKRKDEIGTLYNTLHELMEKNYEQKQIEEMACLKAYQAQIAPHFLYNTLDSINWMLIENEEYTISNIVVALGGLLRYSISNDGNLKTVADELEQIKNYLLIQQVRFGDRLKYSIDIDTAIHQQLIIKLLLQPLVENAVVHGIENTVGLKTIVITGRREGNDIVFSVEDNGAGIPERLLLELNESLKNEVTAFSSRHGLQNVHQRIRLAYSGPYGLTIESVYQKGTRVMIRIPYNPCLNTSEQ